MFTGQKIELKDEFGNVIDEDWVKNWFLNRGFEWYDKL